MPPKLLWIDLEMTGLDPKIDRITEVGVVITDFAYNILDQYETAINLPEEIVKPLYDNNPFWQAMPEQAAQILADMKAGKPDEIVQQEVAQLVKKHFGSEPAILAGNSIHQDRRFIRQWWPNVEKLLHYRMLDVTSFKIITEERGFSFSKSEKHRALADIHESIEELKYCLDILASNNRRNDVQDIQANK